MAKSKRNFFPKNRAEPRGREATRGEVPRDSPKDGATGWVRQTIAAELLSDAHLGTGSGGGGIDALVARDRRGRPVIWASHIEGVLRDAARRLRGNDVAGDFFGRPGGERQHAAFTSLYVKHQAEAAKGTAADRGSHVWRSTARAAFDNRAPKNDTLRVVEHVPKGTQFEGHVELPASELPLLRRLLQEVDAVGGGRAAGAGRVHLTLREGVIARHAVGEATGRLVLLLRNFDPLCITATATPDNVIPSLAFVPGRSILGALAAWLIAESHRDTATLLVGGRISVGDALPVPREPQLLSAAEVLPAPLSLQSEKPEGSAGSVPWWAQARTATRRLDRFRVQANEAKKDGGKLKRPEDDLVAYRANVDEPWETFRPSLRVRLRNGRSDAPIGPMDASLFAIEQIAEETLFLCELRGARGDMMRLASDLGPVLDGRRWLRVGRAGAPVGVERLEWAVEAPAAPLSSSALLTLTSDLLLRDEDLRWCSAVDDGRMRQLPGWPADVCVSPVLQDSVMVHGFNGTSRLWRMPAAAIRRGSVFKIEGKGIADLAEMARTGRWLGERSHEGFGRFRLDSSLPGITSAAPPWNPTDPPVDDVAEEVAAETTHRWFKAHCALTQAATSTNRKPSLSQWLDLVTELDRETPNAVSSRLNPATAGAQGWKHQDAHTILEKIEELPAKARASHARFFVRWLSQGTV
ncbi:MAG: RAMP superfamily CRISPR-associated protein [Polyangiaceae bacterium]|jgi:hypothetical protein